MTDKSAELTLQLNQPAWLRVCKLLRACLDITPRAGFRPITLHATVVDHAATITCHTCNGPAAVRARTTIQNAGADGAPTRLWAASDTVRVDALIMPIRFPLHEEDTK